MRLDDSPITVVSAGFKAFLVPQRVLALRLQCGGRRSVQEHAAAVTASPVFWMYLRPVQEKIGHLPWSTSRHRTVPGEGPGEGYVCPDGPFVPPGENFAATVICADAADQPDLAVLDPRARKALVQFAHYLGMTTATAITVADWAVSLGESPEIGQTSEESREGAGIGTWRPDYLSNTRSKDDPLGGIRLMQTRWAHQCGIVDGLRYEPWDDRASLSHKADRSQRNVPDVLRPAKANPAHVKAMRVLGKLLGLSLKERDNDID